MKNLALIFITLLFFQLTTLSQPCLPEGIWFTTQAQIDSFQVNYPGCTEIEGYVGISGDDIINLNGLSVLTYIGGDLWIGSNDTLTSLTGLDSLTSIGGNLYIAFYDAPTSLTGLGGLTSVGGDLSIEFNVNLTSLTGLDGLTSIGGGLIYDTITL